KRTLTGAIYVCVVIGAVLWNQFSFLGLLLLFSIFCLYEFVLLFKDKQANPPFYATIIFGSLYFLLRELDAAHILPAFFINFAYPLLFLIFIIELYQKRRRSFTSASVGVAGIIYVSLSLWCFTEIGYLGGHY